MSSAAIKNGQTDVKIAESHDALDRENVDVRQASSWHSSMTSERPFLSLTKTKLAKRSIARLRLRQAGCILVLVLADVLAIAASLELAMFFRTHVLARADNSQLLWPISFRHYLDLGWLWVLPIVFLGIEGLYTRRRSLWNEIGQLIKAIALGLVTIQVAVGLTNFSPEISRPTILLTTANLLILLPAERLWVKKCLGALGLWRKRILILGATDTAKLAMRGLASDSVLGYDVVGALDDDPMKRGKSAGRFGRNTVFVLGTLSEVREQMTRTNTRDILIAMPGLPEDKLSILVHGLQPLCDSIYVIPQLWALPMMNLQVGGFLGERVMMLKLSNNLTKPWNAWFKTFFDIVLGIALVLIALPVICVLSFLVKLDSPGPALFIQERLGYRGRNFKFLKLRTMYLDGDQTLLRYLEKNPDAADEWRKYAKLRSYDPRVTRLGRFLRHWSLDELPQLLNVLTGKMSLVGPRPYLPNERDRIGAELPTILSARPGITGLWQVNGRNQLTIEERVQLESWYVRNWTVWLDCIILVKTLRAVLLPQTGCEASESLEVQVPSLRVESRPFSMGEREGISHSD